jgi:mono/diheme cytochrome c family protein
VPAGDSDATPATGGAQGTAEELVLRGLEVYQAQYCGACHELTAAGTGGLFGPAHDAMGTTAAARIEDLAYDGSATTPAEYILESIVQPRAYLVPDYAGSSHPMPAYDFLSEDELMALVELLVTQE